MDVFARKTNKRHILRGLSGLTKYPAKSRKLIPGIAFGAKNPPTKFVPLNTNDYYGYAKSLSKPEPLEQNDVIKVSSSDSNTQIGFGNVAENSDEDISYTSLEKVDPTVLNAFVNPSFKVKSTTLVPLKRKTDHTPDTLLKPKKQRIGSKLKFGK